jgi:hypothetical protein
MFDELLTTAIEAIAKLKTRADEIENNYTLLSNELNGFEDSYAKEYALIRKQIDEIYAQIDRLVNEAVAKIPTPKDGKDGISPTIDYEAIKVFISEAVAALPKPKDGINGKDGTDGKDGANGQNGKDGKDGKDGKNGLNGKDGANGKDGISIIDIKQDKDTLIITLSNNEIKRFKLPSTKQVIQGGGGVSESKVLELIANSSTSGDVSYIRAESTPITVGGATAGTTFDGTLSDALDKILYPFQNPAFTAFSVNSAITFDLGQPFPAGDYIFTWSTSNSENIKENSITLNAETNLPNSGTRTQTLTETVYTTPSSLTFNISGVNINDVTFSRTLFINWRHRRYFGVSPLTSLEDTDIKLLSSEFATDRIKSITYDCTGGRYFYFAYPTSFGNSNNTKVNNLSWNDWVLVKRDFVNDYGVSIPFNIYRSFNLLNGSSIPVIWG